MRRPTKARVLRATSTRAGVAQTAGATTALSASRKYPAGTHDPVSPPSEAAFRRHIEAGICPFCGAGPFQIVATHTYRIHAVDRRELRDRAGITYNTRLVSPELHDRLAARPQAENIKARLRPPSGGKRHYSVAGLRLQREKLAKARETFDIANIGGQAAKAAVDARLEPERREAIRVYREVVAEQGRDYGAVIETSRRIGERQDRTRRLLDRARELGY